MRRRFVVAGAAALGLPAGPLLAQADPEVAGRVTRREGSAIVLRPGGNDEPLEPGAELRRGDRVRTGPAAKLEVAGADGLAVVIGPLSEVDIDDYLPPARGSGLAMILSMLTGIVRLVGPARPPARLEVQTRAAFASVRSTEWLVDATPATTGVFVREGRVAVRGRAGGDGVTLDPGQGTDVATGGLPTPPRLWGAARRDAALARTTL